MINLLSRFFYRITHKDPILSSNPNPCDFWCGMSAIIINSPRNGCPAIAKIINCHGCLTDKKIKAVSVDSGIFLQKNSLVFLVEMQEAGIWTVAPRPL